MALKKRKKETGSRKTSVNRKERYKRRKDSGEPRFNHRVSMTRCLAEMGLITHAFVDAQVLGHDITQCRFFERIGSVAIVR